MFVSKTRLAHHTTSTSSSETNLIAGSSVSALTVRVLGTHEESRWKLQQDTISEQVARSPFFALDTATGLLPRFAQTVKYYAGQTMF